MAQVYDLTKGKESKLILRFFFPILFTNMLQQVYTIADTAIVGKGISDNALAAVGNMSSLTFFILGFSMGLANGFSVSMAHHFGAGDFAKLRRSIAASIKLALAIATFLTIISVTFLRPVLVLMQTDPIIIDDSLTYGYIIFGGLITSIAYNLCACILRALGDSKTSFIAIVVSTFVNIALNSLFILVMGFGVAGAAVATIISQLVSTIICFIKIRKIEIIKLKKEDFKSEPSQYLELLKNGLPMAIMNSITAIGCIVVQYFVNGMNVASTSAYSACSRYINLFMNPAVSSGFAMSAFTSQNYGAGKYHRIVNGFKVCAGISAITYIIFGSFMFFAPRFLAGFMLNGEDSISLAVEFLPRCGLLIIAVDMMFVVRQGCQALGRALVPMLSGVMEMVVRISVIVFLTESLGFKVTAYAEICAWISALLINGIAFALYMKKLIKIEKVAPDNSLCLKNPV